MTVTDPDTEKQLASIFMPYAWKRREEIISRNGRFVHYTSAENAIKIIQSKRLWMRNAKSMNDYTEVSHGHSLLVKAFQDQELVKSFFSALEPCGKDIAKNAISLFDQWWGKIQYNTFISSISEHNPEEDSHGRLSMWRAYGQLSAKAAIVIRMPFEPHDAVKGLHLMSSPVAYYTDDNIRNDLTKIISNISNNVDFLLSQGSVVINNYIFSMLIMASVCIKHPGFKEEKEWRVIYLPDLYPSKLMEHGIEIINGVPQDVYKIPLIENPTENVIGINIPQLIERVILGPSQYTLPLYHAFKGALEEAGVQDAASRVIVSGIPLRT